MRNLPIFQLPLQNLKKTWKPQAGQILSYINLREVDYSPNTSASGVSKKSLTIKFLLPRYAWVPFTHCYSIATLPMFRNQEKVIPFLNIELHL